jgi:hypothetical protein
MIRLLTHPLPPSSPVSKMDWRHTGRLRKRERDKLLTGEGEKEVDEEPNHRIKRNPGPLKILSASTLPPPCRLHPLFKLIRKENH